VIDSEEERAHFGADPDFFLRYRKSIEGYFNSGWKTFYKGSAAQAEAQAGTLAHYQEIFHDETLRNFMTPSFGVGCRRPTTGDNFVRAMQEPNTTVFPFGVTKMNEDGIVHPDGTVNKYDAIVCATGFDTSFTPRFPIHGRNGHELMEDFSKSPEAYLGLAVHGYPNFFMFSGPISPVGNGSAFPGAEGTAEYIAQFLKKFYKEGIRTFEIKQKPQDDFNDWVQAKMPKMVWTDNCDSWCKFSHQLLCLAILIRL
jgi:cation diffusion facilitator CzcD-associated flavoprotein CzcO